MSLFGGLRKHKRSTEIEEIRILEDKIATVKSQRFLALRAKVLSLETRITTLETEVVAIEALIKARTLIPRIARVITPEDTEHMQAAGRP